MSPYGITIRKEPLREAELLFLNLTCSRFIFRISRRRCKLRAGIIGTRYYVSTVPPERRRLRGMR